MGIQSHFKTLGEKKSKKKRNCSKLGTFGTVGRLTEIKLESYSGLLYNAGSLNYRKELWFCQSAIGKHRCHGHLLCFMLKVSLTLFFLL